MKPLELSHETPAVFAMTEHCERIEPDLEQDSNDSVIRGGEMSSGEKEQFFNRSSCRYVLTIGTMDVSGEKMYRCRI